MDGWKDDGGRWRPRRGAAVNNPFCGVYSLGCSASAGKARIRMSTPHRCWWQKRSRFWVSCAEVKLERSARPRRMPLKFRVGGYPSAVATIEYHTVELLCKKFSLSLLQHLPSRDIPTPMHFFSRQYWQRFRFILRMAHCWFLVQGRYWIFCCIERRKKP